MIIYKIIFFALTCIVPKCLSSVEAIIVNSDLKLSNVERIIDISTQIVRVMNRFRITNFGTNDVNQFLYTVEPEYVDKLSYINAKNGETDETLYIYNGTYKNNTVHVVTFTTPLESKKFKTIDVMYDLTDVLVPYPTRITQNEDQFVKYTGNAYLYTPYEVSKILTSIELKIKVVEDYTKVDPCNFSESRIYYGPYEDVPAFSKKDVHIHYLNNSPFLVVSYLERTIEISHWGNIAVEEDITLEHVGAKLKGPFSRFDFHRDVTPSVRALRTVLPREATDIYYRDEIGNISTSTLDFADHSIAVDIVPRFPLFGGWSTKYKLGYNLPTSSYLYSNGEKYVLKMNLIDVIYHNMVIKEAIVKVILPEGSSNIKLDTPFNVREFPIGVHFTYLDIVGRPVISFSKENLVLYHIQQFNLWYTFPKIYMLREPFLLVAFLLLLFVSVIIYVRLDFSLSADEIAEQKLRISGFCNKILNNQDGRSAIYQNIEEKLALFKTNKDVNVLNTSIKNFNNQHKFYSNQFQELAVKLKSESSEIFEKVAELQKLDKQLKDIFTQQQTLYVEKLAAGKITKTQFAESENNINKKKEECVDKMNKILKTIV